MPTSPITLQAPSGLYTIVKGHLMMLYTGAWVLDLEVDAGSLAQFGLPSGRCVATFGGVPMSGTVDPSSSGTFGPTARVRLVAGGNGWSTSAPRQQWHADNGILSTTVYQAIAASVGEVLVDIVPEALGVDFIYNGTDPASSVFLDSPWFVNPTGTTYVGPRPPAIPNPSLIVRDWDPVHQKASFSCDSLLLPGTPLVDPRFNGSTFTVYNVEQVFDAHGSTGWAWSNAAGAIGTPSTLIIDQLKAAVLHWVRASTLRAFRYRLIQYQGDGPGGGPSRMALQAVNPTAGAPDMIPVAPWSGVAGVVAELAPSQEVLVLFENASPALPRPIAYSLVATDGEPLGLPLSITADAQIELDLGPTVPMVNIAGGSDALVLAKPYAALLAALTTFAGSLSASIDPTLVTAAGILASALGSLPPAPTLKTKAT